MKMEIYRDDFEDHMKITEITEPGKFTNLIMAFKCYLEFHWLKGYPIIINTRFSHLIFSEWTELTSSKEAKLANKWLYRRNECTK